MKCIQYEGGTIKRVVDTFAKEEVGRGVARYIPKSLWRSFARPKLSGTFAVEGVIAKSREEEGKRVIEEVKLTGVSMKKRMKAKDRRVIEKKRRVRKWQAIS